MTTAQLKPKPCDGNTIRLLPQWPPGWDADFKLHAPANTVVTGAVKGGRLARLDITPSSRRKDVLVHSSRHAAMIITRCSHPRCLPIARA